MTDNLRGIVAVLVSSVAFVLNDVCVKLVSDELPSGEILVVRGVLATAMLAAGVVAFGAVRPLGLLFTPMMLLRLASAAGERCSSSYRCAICRSQPSSPCCRSRRSR